MTAKSFREEMLHLAREAELRGDYGCCVRALTADYYEYLEWRREIDLATYH